MPSLPWEKGESILDPWPQKVGEWDTTRPSYSTQLTDTTIKSDGTNKVLRSYTVQDTPEILSSVREPNVSLFNLVTSTLDWERVGPFLTFDS